MYIITLQSAPWIDAYSNPCSFPPLHNVCHHAFSIRNCLTLVNQSSRPFSSAPQSLIAIIWHVVSISSISLQSLLIYVITAAIISHMQETPVRVGGENTNITIGSEIHNAALCAPATVAPPQVFTLQKAIFVFMCFYLGKSEHQRSSASRLKIKVSMKI